MKTEGLESPPHVCPTLLRHAQERLRKCARGRPGLADTGIFGFWLALTWGAGLKALQLAVSMLRVVSWNINGIRSPVQGVGNEEPSNCTAMAMGRILDKLDADIVCLQETKVTSERSRIQDPYHTFPFPLTFALCSVSFNFPISLSLESSP